MDKTIERLAWYFPNWHQDPRNDEWHGKGWTEWEVVKCARPRFEGHEQPNVPLWGYLDEADPSVMERKIQTAMHYGITGFLWDLYWFEDGGYRMRALDEGFFGAPSHDKFKIALMWCNHDPIYAHPATRRRPNDPLMSGDMTPEGFRKATDYFIEHYFCRRNYLRVDGKVFFVLFTVSKFLKNFGGVEKTRAIFDDFRDRARKAGVGELQLAAQVTNCGCRNTQELDDLMDQLGLDECVRYSWPTDSTHFPRMAYSDFVSRGIATFEKDCALKHPMDITVSNGWDSSPRTVQSEKYENVGYPFSVVVTGRNTADYERALRAAKAFMESGRFHGHLLTFSTWNEWTEGNYLEPDERFGYGFLEKIREVFGTVPDGKET